MKSPFESTRKALFAPKLTSKDAAQLLLLLDASAGRFGKDAQAMSDCAMGCWGEDCPECTPLLKRVFLRYRLPRVLNGLPLSRMGSA